MIYKVVGCTVFVIRSNGSRSKVATYSTRQRARDAAGKLSMLNVPRVGGHQ